MKRRKPDLLLILIILFGLGFIATNYSYAFWSERIVHTTAKEQANSFYADVPMGVGFSSSRESFRNL